MANLKLKELQRKYSELQAYKESINLTKTELTTLSTIINGNLKVIGKEIQRLKNEVVDMSITDHAVLRYLERYQNLNTEKIKQKILDLPADEKVIVENKVLTVGEILKNERQPRFKNKKVRKSLQPNTNS